ncbi:MAG: DUF5317 domain-containing protein [Anaerolineales bacterium]|nr:DUF5317 domain-containing protein [Anaerolineales bacterium]
MILLIALLAGWLSGLAYAHWQKRSYQTPRISFIWLAFVAFVPQALAFYLPATRARIPDAWAAASLIASQVLLLLFAWVNRKLAGMWLLILGLVLNLVVIASNGGFMPISPETAARLVPVAVVQAIQPGHRLGFSKDILLLTEDTRLVWLSDRFLLPAWFFYQVAFSLGDIFIACGIFWLLMRQGIPLRLFERYKHK